MLDTLPNNTALPFRLSELSVHNASSSVLQLLDLQAPYMVVLMILEKGILSYAAITAGQSSADSLNISTDRMLQNQSTHKHNYYDLMIVLRGTVKQQIEDQTYLYYSGQCCLVNPNVCHRDEIIVDGEILYLGLSEEFFQVLVSSDLIFDNAGHSVLRTNPIYNLLQNRQRADISKSYVDFFPRVPSETIIPQLEQQLGQLITEAREQKPGSYLLVQGYIIRLLHFLTDPTKYILRFVDLDNSKTEQLFSQIQLLLEESNGRISRQALAEILNYSDHYLCRIVQQQSGMSFKAYARVFLLKKAAQMLITTDMPVSQIITELGLANTTYFHHIFKEEYGMTPYAYRKYMTSSNQTH